MATKYAPIPLASAWTNTTSSGITRNRPRNSSATAINSSRARPGRRPLESTSAAAMSRQSPVLQGVDSEHECEGQDQHHHGDGRGAGVIVLLQFGDDQQRRDLGFHGHIARDKDHGTVLAHGACKAERKPGEQGGPQRRQYDARKSLQRRGAERRRRLLHFPVQILEHRLQRAHYEWQADER